MILGELCRRFERIAPLGLAAEWDNNGLLVGDPAADVGRILLAIDLTDAVLDEAIASAAHLVLCYHPPIFKPLRRLRPDDRGPGGRVFRAIRHHVALYAMHTTLDAAADGTNDALAEVLALAEVRPLAPHRPEPNRYKLVTFVPGESADRVAEAIFAAAAGAGVIGDYSHCGFRVAGTGTFRGEPGAAPAVGRPGRLERVDEVRLEVVLPTDSAAAAVAALRTAHPYEEVAFDLYPLAAMDERVGLGRIGKLAQPATLDELVARIKRGLSVEAVWLAAPTNALAAGSRLNNSTDALAAGSRLNGAAAPNLAPQANALINTAACCAGSCGELFRRAMVAGAGLYLTGELRHHDALEAAAGGMAVVAVRHSASERLVLGRLARRIAALDPALDPRVSRADADPFRWA